MARIGVVGAGAWGTALAVVAARAGHAVTLWGRDPAASSGWRASAMNAAYLPGIALPATIRLDRRHRRGRRCRDGAARGAGAAAARGRAVCCRPAPHRW